MNIVRYRGHLLLLAMALAIGAPARATAAPEGTPCPAEPGDMVVGYGDLVTCAIDVPGDSDLFRFSGAAGEVIRISLSGASSTFVKPCLTLFGPDGAVETTACADSITSATLAASGTHTIEVSEYGNDQALAYRLGLERLVPTSVTATSIPFGVTVSDEINPPGDSDLFVFDGLVGDAIRISLSGASSTFVKPCLTLFGPDGAVETTACANSITTATLASSGTHTIEVSEYGNDQTRPYTLQIQCLTGPTCGLPSGAQPDAPVPCHTTIGSGAGEQLLKFCLSDRGNLSLFESPAGAEHLRVGAHGEGYAVCSAAGTHGYDVGYAGVGFGSPTITQPKGPDTLPLTIVRTSLDGAIRVTQTFARDSKEKDVTITMTVKNTSTATLTGVQLTRYFDGDIDGSQGDDAYARTVDSSGGWQVPAGNGLMLMAGTLNIAHATGVETFWEWHPGAGGAAGATACGPGHAPGARGDYVGRLNYSLGNLGPGKSKVLKFIYQRF